MSAVFDARGCLTEAGFAALDAAPPGRGPQDAAAHLTACALCQRRYLARAGERGAGIRLVPGKAQAPPLWRTFVIAAAALLLVATAIYGLRLLRG